MSQVTSFPYEVLVRDDGSTDGTKELLLSLEEEFPEKVRLILESCNTFARVKPLIPLFAEARGEFFAVCEGDDYWISSKKLQVSVETLQRNSDLVMVGHLSAFERADASEINDQEVRTFGESRRFQRGEIPRLHTSSMVARTEVFREAYAQWPDLLAGDMKLKVIASEAGETVVLKELMSVIGNHSEGVWQSLTTLEKAQRNFETYVKLRCVTRVSKKSFKDEYHQIGHSDIDALHASGRKRAALLLWVKWFVVQKVLR